MKPNDKTTPPGRQRTLWSVIRRPLAIYSLLAAILFLLAVVADFNTFYTVENSTGSHTWRMPVPLEVLVFLFVAFWLIGFAIILFWGNRRLSAGNAPGSVAAGLYRSAINREQIQKTIQRRYQGRFWLAALLYTLILALLGGAMLFIKDSNVWYAEDPLYPLLNALKDLSPVIVVLLWTLGIVVLLFRQWRQSASDIVALIDSIEQMQKDEVNITVPPNLAEVRPVLQEIQLESQKSRQAAKEAEQRKNELIVYLAHDLKTPLTSVVGYLSLMNEVPDMPPEQRAKYTSIALDKAYRLESLISQFFEISRYNLQEMVLEEEPVDLTYLLVQLAEEFYPLLSAEEKTARLNLAEELWMEGDAGKLARVFNNILRNAAAHSNPGSEIEVKAWQEGDSLFVSTTNQGKTIPAHKLEAIFDKFYRLDESRGSESGGAGLGLAIAQEIVTLHGGAITAQSEGGSTTFTVRLPAISAPDSQNPKNI